MTSEVRIQDCLSSHLDLNWNLTTDKNLNSARHQWWRVQELEIENMIMTIIK